MNEIWMLWLYCWNLWIFLYYLWVVYMKSLKLNIVSYEIAFTQSVTSIVTERGILKLELLRGWFQATSS